MNWLQDKRLLLCLAITVGVALYFWTGSRYPELNAKATMGAVADLQTLGLGVAWEIAPDDGRIMRIVKGTINWLDANKRGMLFGLILAAGMMTGLAALPRRKNSRSRFANTFVGFAVGSPLGVCVNCATPVMRGMHAGGARMETSLATMFSSPTFNVIVLSMLFTLFPLHFALVKIGFSLALVFIGVPLAGRMWGQRVKGGPRGDDTCELSPPVETVGWRESLLWVAKKLPRNFLVICMLTVPFMILAGLLGAIMNEFLPTEKLLDTLASHGHLATFLAMIGIALVATFLPVPMAMDLILAASLYAAGLPAKYVMPILFSTGIYSILAFLVIYRDLSRGLAVAIFATVVALGVASGGVAHFFEKSHDARLENYFVAAMRHAPETDPPSPPPPPVGLDFSQLKTEFEDRQIDWKNVPTLSSEKFSVKRDSFAAPKSTATDSRIFENYDAREIGIETTWVATPERLLDMRTRLGRAIASGDIHNDGWPDLVLANDFYGGGLTVFTNLGGERFTAQKVDLGDLADNSVIVVALVDLNNDGWLDLFFSTFRAGSHWIENRAGEFSSDAIRPLSRHTHSCVAAAGFADLNLDGRLDIVLGNWTVGDIAMIPEGAPRTSRNEVLFSKGDHEFELETLPAEPGETLGVFIGNLDREGAPEILIGNDFDEPDAIYRIEPDGKWRHLTRDDGFVPVTPFFNMGSDAADLDNDLNFELFSTNIALGSLSRERKAGKSREDFAALLDDPIVRAEQLDLARRDPLYKNIANITPTRWRRIKNERDRQNSLARFIAFRATAPDKKFSRWFEFYPPHRDDLQWFAERARLEFYRPTEAEISSEIPQVFKRNVLCELDADGKFQDVTERWGVGHTGWTWNAKFADFDLDGWQDLFLVTGFPTRALHEPNRLFLNKNGERFEEVTEANGMGTYLETMAYTHLDWDRDGDLDLFVVPMSGPVDYHENLSSGRVGKHTVTFELLDGIGNRFGIGAQIVARYRGGQQIREIRASGGYLSFDPPVAHFGLGQTEAVDSIEIHWPDGTDDRIAGPFPAGNRYRINRVESVNQ